MHPIQTAKNQRLMGGVSSREQSPSERDRVQQMLFKYREDKILKELEKIEEQRRKAEFDKLKNKEDVIRFRRYNEQLKEKLASH